MPFKEFCDRCGRDVTGKQSGALHGAPESDHDGGGTMTDHADILCRRCYRQVWEFVRTPPAAKAR